MADGRVECTLLWIIEKYNYCWHKRGERLESPYFTVDELVRTSWKICMYPVREKSYPTFVSVYLWRNTEDGGPETVSLNYKLSVFAADGSTLGVSREHKWNYEKGDRIHWLCVPHTKLFLQDTLTVRCWMWMGKGKVRKVAPICARTRIAVENISFLHVVENFSTLKQNQKKTIEVRTHSKKEYFVLSSLHFTNESSSEGEMILEITPMDGNHILLKRKVSLIDEYGNMIACGENEKGLNAETNDIEKMPLFLTRQAILIKKEYLPGDKLSLLCVCIFSSGLEFEEIVGTEYKTPMPILNKASMPTPMPILKEANMQTPMPILKEAIMQTPMPILKEASTPTPTKNEDNTEEKTSSYPIEETRYDNNTPAAKEVLTPTPRENEDNTVERSCAYPSVSEDIKALYIKQSLTDVELKTKTKSFPAHKVVLAVRSPVFEAMFTNNMKEKHNNCIEVEDLADDTVQQMLLYLYSDEVENLPFNSATRLYHAGDKYQIGNLKEVCSSFLLNNLTVTNAAELLDLADSHKDIDLMKCVEDFILEHDKEVFCSKEWESLMQTNPLLVMKTMQSKYKR